MDARFRQWLEEHAKDNFDQVPMMSLGGICQRLGQSGRGTRKELVARINSCMSHTTKEQVDE